MTKDLDIGTKWVFWEQYEDPPEDIKKDQTSKEFEINMQKLAWFHDYLTFWQLWQTLPISKLENYFYNKEIDKVPIFAISKGEVTSKKRISTMAIF